MFTVLLVNLNIFCGMQVHVSYVYWPLKYSPKLINEWSLGVDVDASDNVDGSNEVGGTVYLLWRAVRV